MEVQGTLDKNDIWKVKARGPTFDGRDFFRSLFSLGQLSEKAPKPKNPREGIDLEAEISTVGAADSVVIRVHRHNGVADEVRAALGDQFRQRMARCRSEAEWLAHGHGPIDEPIVWRDERQVDPIAGKGLQRQQRLQAGDTTTDDDDVGGRGRVGRCHGQ